MAWLKQTFSLVIMSLANMRHRLSASMVVTIGIGCAVGMLVSMLSIGAGIETMTTKNVRSDRVIVSGSAGSMAAELSRTDVQTVEGLPGVRHDHNGTPLTSADITVVVEARRKVDNSKARVTIIEMVHDFQRVYPEIQLTAGRVFRPGLHELLVGDNAGRVYRNVGIGEHITYQGFVGP